MLGTVELLGWVEPLELVERGVHLIPEVGLKGVPVEMPSLSETLPGGSGGLFGHGEAPSSCLASAESILSRVYYQAWTKKEDSDAEQNQNSAGFYSEISGFKTERQPNRL